MSLPLSLSSTITLSSSHEMPLLGFGVFQNYDAKASVIEAFKAGYRCVFPSRASAERSIFSFFFLLALGISILHRFIGTKRTSAKA
jgi:hypothetical protein